MTINKLQQDKGRTLIRESIAHEFFQGKLPYKYSRLIDKCLNKYGFSPDYCYAALSESISRHSSFNSIKRDVYILYVCGITDSNKLLIYEKHSDRKKKIYEHLEKALGKRSIYELNRVNHWVDDYDISEEMVILALQANENKERMKFKDIDYTILNMYFSGIKTKADLKKNEEDTRNRRAIIMSNIALAAHSSILEGTTDKQ